MKILLRTAFFMLFALRLSGQTPVEDQVYHWLNTGDTTMTVIRETVYNYLDSTQSPTAPSLAKKFGRWYNYWNSRIDSNDRMDKAWLYMNTYFQTNAPINPNASPPFPFVCNDGGDWSLIGPLIFGSQNLGLVGCLYTPSPYSNVIYAGSNTGGLWRTTNANDPTPTWTCVTDDPRRPAMGVQDIAVDPNDTSTLYIATGITTHTFYPYGSGVLKSTDGGDTWNETGLNALLILENVVSKLKTHPTTSGIVFAGGQHKIWRSLNGGTNWTEVLSAPNIGYIRDIAFLPSNPNIMMAVTNTKIFYSTNTGATWVDMATTNPLNYTHPQCTNFVASAFEIATSPANADAFYIHFGNGDVQCKNCETCQLYNTYEPAYKITYSSSGFQILDTLKNWYLNIGDIPSDYAITDLYWEYNQINDATTWLEDMPNRHEFTSKEQENYDDYKSLKELFKNVFSDNRSLLDLNSSELATLTTLAEKGVALASVQAQNLLNFAYNGNYRKEAYLPEIIQERKLPKEEEEILIENPDWIIKAVPNPSQLQTVLSYQLGDIEGDAHIYIYNVHGQTIFTAQLQKPSGEVLINTSEWPSGTYLCLIRVGKEKSKVYKLSVSK